MEGEYHNDILIDGFFNCFYALLDLDHTWKKYQYSTTPCLRLNDMGNQGSNKLRRDQLNLNIEYGST